MSPTKEPSMAKIARFGSALMLGAAAATSHAQSTVLTSPADFSPSRTHDGFEVNMPTPFFYPNGVGGTTFSVDDPGFPVPRVITDNAARPFIFPAPTSKALSTQGTTIAGSLIIQFAAPVNRIGFHVKTDPADDLFLVLQEQSGGSTIETIPFTATGLTFSFVGIESPVAFDQVRLDIIGTGLGIVNLDDLLFESVLDSDGDGLSDDAEADLGTDPFDPDTDGDDLSDGDEVSLQAMANCPDPLLADSDGDGLNDGLEVLFAPITDPCDQDTDGDGLADGAESGHGTDPLNPDTDGDGLLDGEEVDVQIGGCPDPVNPDSDGDLLADGFEDDSMLDPCDPDSDGDGMPDGLDSSPNDPGSFDDEVAQATDSIANDLGDPGMASEFESALPGNAPASLASTRQNTLANQVAKASRQIEKGNLSSARDMLQSVLTRLEGENAWATGAFADQLVLEIELLISALDAQL